jgi:hypothetical protein
MSDAFTVGSDNEFITPAEASAFTETATYEEVTDFFTRLSAGGVSCRTCDWQRYLDGYHLG